MQTTTAEHAEWNPVPEDIRGCDLMVIAWRDCLMWAIGHSETLQRFTAQTGRPLDLGSRGINALIDQSTGYTAAEVRRFIDWFNTNVWGNVADAPTDSAPFNAEELG